MPAMTRTRPVTAEDPRLTALADQWRQVARHADCVADGYQTATLTSIELTALKHAITGAARLQAMLRETPDAQVPTPQPLTRRQKEVLTGLASGAALTDIAVELGLTTETVRSHATHLYRRLGARNRAHAVIIAVRAGIIT